MLNLLASGGSATINIIALVFVLGFALYGLIRGFIKTFVSMFGTIFSILFAILLCSTVTAFLQEKYTFVTTMAGKLETVTNVIFGKELMNTTLETATQEVMKSAGLSSMVIGLALSFKGNSSIPTDITLNQVVCPTFAYYVVLIISAIGLFIVFKLIFIVIGNIVSRLHNIKLLEKTDRMLGFFLGLIAGIIYFETIVMVIGAIPLGFMQNLYALIQNSSLAHFICVINPYDSILNLISFNDLFKFVSLFIA